MKIKELFSEKNYDKLYPTMTNYLKEFNRKENKKPKKIQKKYFRRLNLEKYINYAIDAKKRQKGSINRDKLEIIKTGYHPWYFLKFFDDELIISFRGTSNFSDIYLDLKILKNKTNNILDTNLNDVSKILFKYGLIKYIKKYNKKKVTIIGHSLGAVYGAYLLLILKTIDLKLYGIDEIDIKLYSFSCPSCITEGMGKIINKDIYAFVNGDDPIVCYTGFSFNSLYTVGGNRIFNFIKKPNNKGSEFIQRDYKYFSNINFIKISLSYKNHYLIAFSKDIYAYLKND